MKEEIESLEAKISTLRQDIENEAAKRVDTVGELMISFKVLNSNEALEPKPQRRTSLTLLHAKRSTLTDLKGELAQHGLADPVVLERKRRGVILAHEASVRWTGRLA